MKKRSTRAAKSSAVLARAFAGIEMLEPRAYLNGVVLGSPINTTPTGLSVSFTTVTKADGTDADFNGDNKTDLVVSDTTDNKVALFLGHGDGTFAAPVTATVQSSPLPIAIADMNGDGNQDIVSGDLGFISIVDGDGTGGLGTVTNIPTNVDDNHAIGVADFDGNNKLDIVSASTTPGANPAAEILLQQTNGTFVQQNLNLGGRSGFAALAVGDFDGKNGPDIALISQSGNTVTVLLNNGDGTFGAPTDYATGSGPTSIVAGDFNGDGKTDLVTANSTGGSVSFLAGDGNGHFAAKVDSAVVGSPAGGGPLKVRTTKINSDTVPDLLVLLSNNSSHLDGAVLLGNGNGTFHTGTTISTGGATRTALAAGNIGGDALTDIIVANSSSITTLLNTTAQDTTAPTFSVPTTQPAATAGSTTYQFNVVYSDNNEVDASTLGNNNLTVTGPGGFSQAATLVSQNLGNGPTVQATYQITFASGLTNANSGTYTVTAATTGAGAVTDANGNDLASPATGTFAISLTAPNTGVTVGPIQGKFLPSVVAGSKGKPVKFKVTNTSGATFKGTYVVTLAASSTGPAIDSSSIVLAQLSKKVNLKNGKSATISINKWNYPTVVGDYFIVVQADNGQGQIGTNATASQVNVAAPFVDLNNLWNAVAPALVAGKKTTLTFKVQNIGNVAAKGTLTVQLQATTGTTLDSTAQTVATVSPVHVSIQPGKSGTVHLRFVPGTINSGTYHLAITLNPLAGFNGINFTSNTVFSANTFTV
ncbi:MAG TPA: VCBS repeat-containing protein [Tepidisphaeraceae bacterium]|nr:VCBS repeat-containing protein [Tepidisphaeraceae bacterium]